MEHIERKPNHLASATSPYLQQHIYNAVDWYEWNDHALQKAKEENKPIFLSIGYSSCHWCHVMSEESFEDRAVGEILNTHFIPIKVDREERPDLDNLYMGVVNMITGSGGWPLNVWLTPDLRPIYGGTYFPKENHVGRAGFVTVLTQIIKLWQDRRDEVLTKGEAMLAHMKKWENHDPLPISDDICKKGARGVMDRFDPPYGGFSGAPKFPSPHQLLYLMAYEQEHKLSELKDMINTTLIGMAAGGIHDHVGGGFARYSVDAKWEIPHFEKMLYDNLLLLKVYNMAYFQYKNPVYKTIAYRIYGFLRREMLSLKGGLFTALDADVDHEEGKYYTFGYQEILDILGDRAKEFLETFHVTMEGNFEGKNHLYINMHRLGNTLYDQHLEDLDKLLIYREARKKPGLDYKILTWLNGLAVGVLAHMARMYGDEQVLIMAKEARDFIHHDLKSEGALVNHITKMQVGNQVFLDDYAFYIEGLIELYMTVYEPSYLDEAIQMMEQAVSYFWDEKQGGFFMTKATQQDVALRQKQFIDGASPSGNSVMGHNLYRLYVLTEDASYENKFRQLMEAYGHYFDRASSHCTYGLLPLLQEQRGSRSLKIAPAQGDIISDYYKEFGVKTMQYDTIHVVKDPQIYPLKNMKRTYYVCEGFVCNEPVNHL